MGEEIGARRRCGEQMEKILRHAVVVELSGNRPGAAPGVPEPRQRSLWPGDAQPVIQPVGVREAQRGVAIRLFWHPA